MRKRLWQLHSWLGLVAGLGLLVIGLTGSLLVFHDELERTFNAAVFAVEPAPGGRRSLDSLLADAERQLPGYEITGWLPQYDHPEYADVLYAIRHGTSEWLVATLDPFTGRLLASPRAGTRTLTGWLLSLHYELFLDHTGVLTAGLLAAALCLLGLTGLWIHRPFWRHLFTLRWSRGARILFGDVHRLVGVTSSAFNLLLGFTGAYWNITHVVGEWSHPVEPPRLERRLYPAALSLEQLARDAARRIPGFRANFISLPSDPGAATITLWGAIEPRGALRGPYGSTLAYDAPSLAHRSTQDLRFAGRWRQVVDAFTPLHFGTFGGWPIRVLWCLGGLAPGILAVTGFLIWRRRPRRPN